MDKKGIRYLAQCYDLDSGEVTEEILLSDEAISKANTLKELGYLHAEQIDFLKKIQDFKIKQQMELYTPTNCPLCNLRIRKQGTFSSRFHGVLTDHKVPMQRVSCSCGWISQSSIDGLYGSSMHPDLLEKQAKQGGEESYEKSSKSLDADSAMKRSINSHSQIFKSVKCVAEQLETIKLSDNYGKPAETAKDLIVNIDGGHIKARGDKRSFEAMLATVHRPENLQYVDKNHNAITSKTIVASAKDDDQVTMKTLLKSACRAQGMTKQSSVTCLADGADNCWSIAHSISNDCLEITFVLDWHHIAMKFKNIAIPEEQKALYDKVKWHLWHGKSESGLIRLEQLKCLIKDESIVRKLDKLSTYINNNKEGIINYGTRKRKGLPYTSNLAESTVNTLINDRQKGKQKMLWGRDGAHNVLQIRTSIASKSWTTDWEKVEKILYKEVA
jgi:hypothetical protein